MSISLAYALNPTVCEIPQDLYVLPKNECPSLISDVHAYFMTNCPTALKDYLGNAEYLLYSGYNCSLSEKQMQQVNAQLPNGEPFGRNCFEPHKDYSLSPTQPSDFQKFWEIQNCIKQHLIAKIIDTNLQQNITFSKFAEIFEQAAQNHAENFKLANITLTEREIIDLFNKNIMQSTFAKEHSNIAPYLGVSLELQSLNGEDTGFTKAPWNHEDQHRSLTAKALALTALQWITIFYFVNKCCFNRQA